MVEMELVSCVVDTRSKIRRRTSTEAVRLVVVVESVADVVTKRTLDWLSVICNSQDAFVTFYAFTHSITRVSVSLFS